MRPRLRPGVVAMPNEDGVVVASPSAGAVVRGKDASALVEVLLPQLDGSRSLDDVAAAFHARSREAVRTVVRTLMSSGVVRDAARDLPHGLSEEEVTHHAETCRLLEGSGQGPGAQLERVLSATLVLVADDRTLLPQARALLHVGFRRLEVDGSHVSDAGVRRRLESLVTDEAAREPVQRARVRWHARPPWDVAGGDSAVAMVCHRLHAGADEVLSIEEAAVLRGITFGAVVWDAGRAWLSPPAGEAWAPGWASMCRRLRSAGRLRWVDGRPGGPSSPVDAVDDAYRTDPVLALAANRAALSMLEAVARPSSGDRTSGPRPGEGWVVDAHTLETARVKVSLHAPGAPPAVQGPDAVARLVREPDAEAAPARGFSSAVATLVDERAGPLLSLGEGDLAQVPLSATTITLADTAGRLEPGRRLQVTEAGVDVVEARNRAARRALEVAQALAAAGGPRWGHEVPSGRPVRLERPLPHVEGATAPDRRTLPGLGSGPSYGAALRRGLLALAADVVARGAVDVVPRRLDPSWFHDPSVESLQAHLRALRPDARCLLLGRLHGLALVAVLDGRRWSALVVDPDPVAALRSALLEAVAEAQGVADPSRAAVRLAPAPGASGPGADEAVACPPAAPEDVIGAAAALLSDAGLRAVALPLDDDPAVAGVAGHVVAVVDEPHSA